jgi:hypothetical protein
MLINNIDTLKKHIPTIVAGEFSKYSQYISDANTWVKRELLGSALFATIKDLSSDSEVPSEHHELVIRTEAIVATKAFIAAIPMLDLIETESGFGVVRTDKIAPASPERVKALIAGTQSKLSDAIEELLDYLEETTAYHEDWKGSPAFTLISNTYIQTLREFRRYAAFEGNRLDFVKFKPKLLEAINLRICPVISTELSDQIIEQLRDDDMTTANTAILENLRYAMSLFATGEEKTATSYLMRVRKVIMTTPDDYLAFKNSSLYATIIAQTTADNSGTIFNTAL